MDYKIKRGFFLGEEYKKTGDIIKNVSTDLAGQLRAKGLAEQVPEQDSGNSGTDGRNAPADEQTQKKTGRQAKKDSGEKNENGGNEVSGDKELPKD